MFKTGTGEGLGMSSTLNGKCVSETKDGIGSVRDFLFQYVSETVAGEAVGNDILIFHITTGSCKILFSYVKYLAHLY